MWIIVVLAAALPTILLRPFRRWVSSMSGAIWILAVVAVLAVLGAGIGQNLPQDAYVERYGATLGELVVITGLSNVFASWYFLTLIAWLAVSLLGCSLTRLRRAAEVRGRNRMSRVGVLVVHLSLVIVLAGGLITGVFGFRYAAGLYLGAGDEMTVTEGGFALRVDAAVTEFTDEGMVREYYSDVAVLEDGVEVATHRIEVNSPLVHRGIGVFQHQMLPSATSVKEIVFGIVVRGEDGDGPLRHINVPFGKDYDVPGTDLTLKALEFYSDFTYDIERGIAVLASVGHRNPAVLVRISQSGNVVDEQWVFADTQVHRRDEGMPCRLFLLDYLPDYEQGLTRFEISHQPGTPLLFAGFVTMSLGLAATFWTRREDGPRRARKDARRGGTEGSVGDGATK